MPLKKHSKNLWRSTEKSESLSGTWWRIRRGIQPSWRGLGLRWSRDRAWKERTRRRRVEMKRRGLRMVLEKVKRRGLCHLPPIRIVFCFFLIFNF